VYINTLHSTSDGEREVFFLHTKKIIYFILANIKKETWTKQAHSVSDTIECYKTIHTR